MRPSIASAAVFVLGLACGRVGFDPSEVRSDATPDDGALGRDSMSDGATADAPPSACAAAMVIPLATRVAINTCDDGMDRLDGCGRAGTQEVIARFVAPVAGGYSVRAYDPGTQNVSTSIGVLDAACATVGPCAGVYGTSLAAGEVLDFALEASAGGCVSVELEIQ